MKKIMLLMAFPLFFCSSCSKDENENENGGKIDFIQIKVTSDDAESPGGIISLFYLQRANSLIDYELKYSPNITGEMVYAVRSDNETIFPVSKISGDKLLVSSKESYSAHSFFWNNLSSLYGVPTVGGKYIIFIKLDCGKYPRTYKILTIDGNKSIDVHIPSASDYSECVEAEWNIKNYSE